jgi:hypothetical protein
VSGWVEAEFEVLGELIGEGEQFPGVGDSSGDVAGAGFAGPDSQACRFVVFAFALVELLDEVLDLLPGCLYQEEPAAVAADWASLAHHAGTAAWLRCGSLDRADLRANPLYEFRQGASRPTRLGWPEHLTYKINTPMLWDGKREASSDGRREVGQL